MAISKRPIRRLRINSRPLKRRKNKVKLCSSSSSLCIKWRELKETDKQLWNKKFKKPKENLSKLNL